MLELCSSLGSSRQDLKIKICFLIIIITHNNSIGGGDSM
jgi:hypothetical protein